MEERFGIHSLHQTYHLYISLLCSNNSKLHGDGKGGNQKSICLNPCNNGKLYSGIGVAGGIPVANRSVKTLSRTSQVFIFLYDGSFMSSLVYMPFN